MGIGRPEQRGRVGPAAGAKVQGTQSQEGCRAPHQLEAVEADVKEEREMTRQILPMIEARSAARGAYRTTDRVCSREKGRSILSRREEGRRGIPDTGYCSVLAKGNTDIGKRKQVPV